MKEQGISDALTSDQHFVQAGFHALLSKDFGPGRQTPARFNRWGMSERDVQELRYIRIPDNSSLRRVRRFGSIFPSVKPVSRSRTGITSL